MTGKLAEKLPLTMSSLINAIPDSLYPEEDIPTSSMNIFTSTDPVSHYSQMNTGNFGTDLSVCDVERVGIVIVFVAYPTVHEPHSVSRCVARGCVARAVIRQHVFIPCISALLGVCVCVWRYGGNCSRLLKLLQW